MPQELSFAFRILGGSAQEAISDIRRSINDPDQLNTLLGHELSHMNRSSVVKAIEARLKKVRRSMQPQYTEDDIREAFESGYYGGAGDDAWHEDHDDDGKLKNKHVLSLMEEHVNGMNTR